MTRCGERPSPATCVCGLVVAFMVPFLLLAPLPLAPGVWHAHPTIAWFPQLQPQESPPQSRRGVSLWCPSEDPSLSPSAEHPPDGLKCLPRRRAAELDAVAAWLQRFLDRPAAWPSGWSLRTRREGDR
eukprot:RCo006582